jgi:hypothetical protein
MQLVPASGYLISPNYVPKSYPLQVVRSELCLCRLKIDDIPTEMSAKALLSYEKRKLEFHEIVYHLSFKSNSNKLPRL